MKWAQLILFSAFLVAANSCTTMVNQRDLYSPAPAPDSKEALRRWTANTQIEETPAPRPQFR